MNKGFYDNVGVFFSASCPLYILDKVAKLKAT